jgi:predicted nucleotidyltransferase
VTLTFVAGKVGTHVTAAESGRVVGVYSGSLALGDAAVSNTAAIDEHRLAAAAGVLAACDGVQTAYLLGSAGAGRLRSDSDVDVAILPSRRGGLSVQDRLALTATLTRVFGRPVDLGVLTTANAVYAKEAVATGRVLFERDRNATARFEMLALSMYATLQEARRVVLQAYAA